MAEPNIHKADPNGAALVEGCHLLSHLSTHTPRFPLKILGAGIVNALDLLSERMLPVPQEHSQPGLELFSLPGPSAMGPSSRAGVGGAGRWGKGGHYRGQLWGGEELLELLELLLLLLQEVSLLLR